MDQWVDGWMDGWINKQTPSHLFLLLPLNVTFVVAIIVIINRILAIISEKKFQSKVKLFFLSSVLKPLHCLPSFLIFLISIHHCLSYFYCNIYCYKWMLYLQLTHTKAFMLLLLILSVCLSVHVSVLSYCTTQSDEEEEEERRECVSRSWSTWLTNFLTSSKFWGRTLLEPSISSTRSMLPDLQAERGEPRGGARVWRFLLIWWSHYLTSHWLMLKVWRGAARLIVKKHCNLHLDVRRSHF